MCQLGCVGAGGRPVLCEFTVMAGRDPARWQQHRHDKVRRARPPVRPLDMPLLKLQTLASGSASLIQAVQEVLAPQGRPGGFDGPAACPSIFPVLRHWVGSVCSKTCDALKLRHFWRSARVTLGNIAGILKFPHPAPSTTTRPHYQSSQSLARSSSSIHQEL